MNAKGEGGGSEGCSSFSAFGPLSFASQISNWISLFSRFGRLYAYWHICLYIPLSFSTFILLASRPTTIKLPPLIGENRQLVTHEPVEFEK